MNMTMRAGIHRWSGALGMAALALVPAACDSDPARPQAPVPVAEILMTPLDMDLVVGDTLTVQALPMSADQEPLLDRTVLWSTDDTLVATVSSTGKVTGVGGGVTNISAKAGNVTAVAMVTVVDPVAESPSITEISPTSVVAGSGTLTLTVRGSAFIPGSVVLWNGEERETTRVSPVELRAIIPAADVEDAGFVEVRVEHPAGGGGVSGAAAFAITTPGSGTPPMAIQELIPASVPAGSVAFTLTVQGTGLEEGTLVLWNGTARPTTRTAEGRVEATIDVMDVWYPEEVAVQLYHPDRGLSEEETFVVGPSGIHHIEVDPTSLELDSGDEGIILARLVAADGSELEGRHIWWSTSNSGVVNVYGDGSYRAMTPGTARLRVGSANLHVYVEATVRPHPVAFATLSPNLSVLLPGEVATLVASLYGPAGQLLDGRLITWLSSNPYVATVNATGTVSALRPGTAQITAESEGVTATATVEVRNWPTTSPWAFDLRWPDPMAVRPTVGDTTWVDASGVERTASMWLHAAELTVDVEKMTYLQVFLLRAEGIPGDIIRTDYGTVEHKWTGDGFDFRSQLFPGRYSLTDYPNRGDLQVSQEVGTAERTTYLYVIR